MSDVMKEANEFIRMLQEQHEAYQDFARDEVEPLFRDLEQQERKPPSHFKNSSFLYLRSFDSDNGSRPFGNKVFWLSPDILISPISSLGAYTRTLKAGETYNIRCVLRNRGDRIIPSAKVELFLTDPSLGFDTRFADHLNFGRVLTTWVNPYHSGQVNFTYRVPDSQSGHKCLFARAFSFSPLEMPVDDTRLDPTIDRRIAQQNLNIVQQGQPYQFNWIHAPNAQQVIGFTAMRPQEMTALRHPILAEIEPFTDFNTREWVGRAGVEVVDSDGSIDFRQEHDHFVMEAREQEGFDVEEMREIRRMVHDALAEIDAGKSHMRDHQDLFARFRDMNEPVRRTTFHMHVPDLGLRQGQAVGVHIRSADPQMRAASMTGGITLLITA